MCSNGNKKAPFMITKSAFVYVLVIFKLVRLRYLAKLYLQ